MARRERASILGEGNEETLRSLLQVCLVMRSTQVRPMPVEFVVRLRTGHKPVATTFLFKLRTGHKPVATTPRSLLQVSTGRKPVATTPVVLSATADGADIVYRSTRGIHRAHREGDPALVPSSVDMSGTMLFS